MQECQQFFKEMLCTFQHKLVPNFPVQEIILFQLYVWKWKVYFAPIHSLLNAYKLNAFFPFLHTGEDTSQSKERM